MNAQAVITQINNGHFSLVSGSLPFSDKLVFINGRYFGKNSSSWILSDENTAKDVIKKTGIGFSIFAIDGDGFYRTESHSTSNVGEEYTISKCFCRDYIKS